MLDAIRSAQLPCAVHKVLADREDSPPSAAGGAGKGWQPEPPEQPRRSPVPLITQSPDPLPPEDYVQSMLGSIFALVPAGNNPETFRHHEAAAAGAIPVSVRPPPDRSYLPQWCSEWPAQEPPAGPLARWQTVVQEDKKAAGGRRVLWCPMVVLESWRQLPEFLWSIVEPAAADPEVAELTAGRARYELKPGLAAELDALQRSAVGWQRSFEASVGRQVASVVRASWRAHEEREGAAAAVAVVVGPGPGSTSP